MSNNELIKKIRTANPSIVLVGRVNVGKSTLFNRLAGEARALVSDIPGTTRDTKSAEITWRGETFKLTDTGGFTVKSENLQPLQSIIAAHAEKEIQNADIILFLVDTKTGIVALDRQIIKSLRKLIANRPTLTTLLIANKADSPEKRNKATEFAKLGFGDPIPVSAANGSGTGDLLDTIVNHIRKDALQISSSEGRFSSEEQYDPASKSIQVNETKICIIGKPNVGKSSLLNAIMGEEKAIVSPIPHTTREPNDESIIYKNNHLTIIDTAGIRRKKQKGDPMEKGGVTMSINRLHKSDIAWLVLDAQNLISQQDRKLAREITDSYKSCIIVVNKWDLITDKTTNTLDEFKKTIHYLFPHLSWAPIVFLSAFTKKHVESILEKTLEVMQTSAMDIHDNALDKFLKKTLKHQPPPRLGAKKKRPFLSHLTQISCAPPVFTLESDSLYKLPASYIQYIENQMRSKFKFTGTPIRISIKYKKIK